MVVDRNSVDGGNGKARASRAASKNRECEKLLRLQTALWPGERAALRASPRRPLRTVVSLLERGRLEMRQEGKNLRTWYGDG